MTLITYDRRTAPTALRLLVTSRSALREAERAESAGERYATAHLAALRCAAAILAARAPLVERAAGHGMDALALTDRDGVYGAVKFVTACMRAGIRPILGVNLALGPSHRPASSARRTPARGGAFVDHLLPRVTVLA